MELVELPRIIFPMPPATIRTADIGWWSTNAAERIIFKQKSTAIAGSIVHEKFLTKITGIASTTKGMIKGTKITGVKIAMINPSKGPCEVAVEFFRDFAPRSKRKSVQFPKSEATSRAYSSNLSATIFGRHRLVFV